MIAIIHGKLLTVTQGVIEDGTLLIDQGKIKIGRASCRERV